MKTCLACGETKPLSEMVRLGEKHRPRCKPCHVNEQKARYRKHRDAITAKAKAYYESRKDDPAFKRAKRRYHIKNRYGLDAEAFDGLVIAQCGRCAICNVQTDLVIDHCHDNGEVRGLLCQRCNITVGHFETHPDLEAVFLYLRGGAA